MNIVADNSVPVVQLAQGLALVGLTLKADGRGGLVIIQSPDYVRDGHTGSGHVPSFCRFEPVPEVFNVTF
jgi:hypothetical protein